MNWHHQNLNRHWKDNYQKERKGGNKEENNFFEISFDDLENDEKTGEKVKALLEGEAGKKLNGKGEISTHLRKLHQMLKNLTKLKGGENEQAQFKKELTKTWIYVVYTAARKNKPWAKCLNETLKKIIDKQNAREYIERLITIFEAAIARSKM
jgi:CRISPR type III-A-associated protein Csm2